MNNTGHILNKLSIFCCLINCFCLIWIMSLIYKRKGHERTNAQGTTFWVSEHKVKKDFYSVRTENGQVVINGITKLLLGSCHNCRGTVFYADISSNKRIFFSNNTEPLIRHDCRQKRQSKLLQVSDQKRKGTVVGWCFNYVFLIFKHKTNRSRPTAPIHTPTT